MASSHLMARDPDALGFACPQRAGVDLPGLILCQPDSGEMALEVCSPWKHQALRAVAALAAIRLQGLRRCQKFRRARHGRGSALYPSLFHVRL